MTRDAAKYDIYFKFKQALVYSLGYCLSLSDEDFVKIFTAKKDDDIGNFLSGDIF